MEKLSNFINGQYVAPSNGRYLDNYEPATGQVYSLIPDSDAHDVEAAVQAAEAAFPIWSSMGIEGRAQILRKLSEGIEANMDAFVAAESKDNGKPVSLAQHVDIPRAVSNFHFFATAIEHFASESHQMEGVGLNYTTRKPIGVVGCISPWNLPLYLFSWKIAPALAAGNCVVAKPSEVTPYTAYMLGKIAKEAGVALALTLSDVSMIQFCKAGLDAMLGDGVDYLFCNQEEAQVWCDSQDLNVVKDSLKKLAKMVCLTRGPEGSEIITAAQSWHVPADKVKAIDTNGAGDMFAGAFLYAISRGYSADKAAYLGNHAAAAVVSQHGNRLTLGQLSTIKAYALPPLK